jgi:hypothetical protein
VIQTAQISHKPSPGWISWLLLVGAVALFAWGWLVLSFLAEPSAVGRIWVALLVIGGASMAASVLGVIAVAGLIRGARWAHTVALLASVAMILSVVGAVAGIPALIGIVAGRNSTSN